MVKRFAPDTAPDAPELLAAIEAELGAAIANDDEYAGCRVTPVVMRVIVPMRVTIRVPVIMRMPLPKRTRMPPHHQLLNNKENPQPHHHGQTDAVRAVRPDALHRIRQQRKQCRA